MPWKKALAPLKNLIVEKCIFDYDYQKLKRKHEGNGKV